MKKINKNHVIMGIYNMLMVLFMLTIDWSDWSGMMGFLMLMFLILMFNPMLNFIMYSKEKDKLIHIFISYMLTILVPMMFYLLKAGLMDNAF